MKFLATTVVLLTLAANPGLAADTERAGPGLESAASRAAEPRDGQEDPRLALAIFGVAALGAVGLMWVRRRNSEP